MLRIITVSRHVTRFLRTLGRVSLRLPDLFLLSLPPALALFGSSLADTSIASDAVGDFADQALSGWSERSFAGHTQYELVEDGGFDVLQARTSGQASVLYRKQKISLSETPQMHWSWKISGIYPGIDEQTKAGDDFPARLYVVTKTGLLPWQTLAINYVWSSSVPSGTYWPNPFTGKAIMVSVRSGESAVNQWVSQQRDVAADFRRFHGVEVDTLDGYAVMVDGDNSGNATTSWFGRISFSAAEKDAGIVD